MSKLKIVLIIFVTAITVGMAACYFYKPLYYKFYLGDRITGSIKSSVDGVPVILNKDCFAASEDFKVTVNEFDTSVAINGGEYKVYTFGFFIQGVNKPVQVNVCQHNWWSVTDFEINAAASTDGNIISIAVVETLLDDKGEEYTQSKNINIDTDNEDIEIFIGGA